MSEAQEIRVEISILDFMREAAGIPASFFETWCIGKLKDAGIPIEGTLVFGKLKRGILTRFNDPKTGKIIFLWKEKDLHDTISE